MDRSNALNAGIAAVAGGLAMLVGLIVFHVVLPESERCRWEQSLTVIGGEDVSAGAQRSAMITAGWGGKGKIRSAKVRELSGVADYQHSEMIATARSGACLADLYLLDTPWIAEFAEAELIAPVDESEVDLGVLYRNVRETGRYDGRLWAVPFNTDAPLLYYWKDLTGLDERTVPGRWADLKKAAMEVTTSGSRLSGGYATQLDEYEGLTVNLLELVRTYGDDIKPGAAPGRRALESALTDLFSVSGGRPLIAASSVGAKEKETIDEFRARRVAFMRNWPYAYGVLAEAGGDRLGVAAFPGAKVLGGQSLAVAAGLPENRRAAAYELLRHLIDERQQRFLFTCGGFAPVRPDAYDPIDPTQCPANTQGTTKKKVTLHPEARFVDQAIRQAAPRPVTPYYPQFSRALQARLHESLDCAVRRRSCPPVTTLATELIKDLNLAASGR